MNSITKKISILRLMHCPRCLTSYRISCYPKCRKCVLTNAHSRIDLWIILRSTIWFGMRNHHAIYLKCNDRYASCNDVT